MEVVEKLIGFDIRESILNSFDWPEERRQLYLIKDSISKPLSVDSNVWPLHSLWNERDQESIFASYPFWSNLEDLYSDLGAYKSSTDYSIISIKAVVSCEDEEDFEKSFMPPIATDENKGWEFLGYDVADSGMISGLSNCGYNIQETKSLKLVWEDSLNDYHLLNHINKAYQFKEMTNMRIPEHRPFFVYAISVLR